MENLTFSLQDKLFKENKLKRVIVSKISDVSDRNIDKILQSIDINKQYYIKATRNPRKFLNIITEEKVFGSDDCFTSTVEIIYGACVPGKFTKMCDEKSMMEGSLDHAVPAAAVKTIVESSQNKQKSVEHMLVIYEPMPKASGRAIIH